MPSIPKVDKQNSNELKSSKNFIKENINKIMNSLPTCPRRYIVSDKKGNKFLINGSGLQKDYIYKKVIFKFLKKRGSIRLLCNLPSWILQMDPDRFLELRLYIRKSQLAAYFILEGHE